MKAKINGALREGSIIEILEFDEHCGHRSSLYDVPTVLFVTTMHNSGFDNAYAVEGWHPQDWCYLAHVDEGNPTHTWFMIVAKYKVLYY